MHLILSVEENSKINELIKLLTPFKDVGEVLGREKDITLTCIVPMFNYLEGTVLVQDHRNDSAMIQDMKIHMLTKLKNRYNEQQWKFLNTVSILDPRVKAKLWDEYCIFISWIIAESLRWS